MTINEITSAIISSELTATELSQISQALKFKRDQITASNKLLLKAGQNIEVRSTRSNFKGTIVKINKKTCDDRCVEGKLYAVPMELIYAQ